jgi:uncharacterized membrane protein (UPF0127 family)
MIWTLIGIVVVVVALVTAYLGIFHKANQPLAKNEVKIGSAVFEAEAATTMTERARGLSFRPSLGENQGMLFLFGKPAAQSFWMKDMNFPIDIIWIGGDAVLGFAQNAAPQPGVPLWGLTLYRSPDGTDKVLEVNAGTVAKDGIKVGDRVQIGI